MTQGGEGDGYRARRLADESEHIVLKSFAAEAELAADARGGATGGRIWGARVIRAVQSKKSS
jgi:hypothetical protein